MKILVLGLAVMALVWAAQAQADGGGASGQPRHFQVLGRELEHQALE